jgi:hypothetical protein
MTIEGLESKIKKVCVCVCFFYLLEENIMFSIAECWTGWEKQALVQVDKIRRYGRYPGGSVVYAKNIIDQYYVNIGTEVEE